MPNPIFFIVAFFAEIIGTMAGFGSSTVLLPVALFFFDFQTALVLVAIFHLSGNIGRVTFFRQGISWKLFFTFGLASIIFTLIGSFLVSHVSQEVLKGSLGLFLVAFVVYSFIKPKFTIRLNGRNSIIGGSTSGFLAGLIGTGGAVRGAFLTSFNLEKSVYIATAAIISLSVDITRIPVYLYSGFLDKNFYIFIPLLFVIAIIGSYIGKKIVGHIPQDKFRKFVLVVIGLVSIKFIFDGFFG